MQKNQVSQTAAETAVARAERERIAAILVCPEAYRREQLAQHLALQTDLPVEQVKGLLAVSPMEKPKLDYDKLKEWNGNDISSGSYPGNGSQQGLPDPKSVYAKRRQYMTGGLLGSEEDARAAQ